MKIYLDNCCFNRPYDETGIKMKDAYHVACAVYSFCDYFLTTDDRLLKYYTNEIQMLNPIDFIRRLEEDLNGQ